MTIGLTVAVVLALAVAPGLLTARAQSRPGDMTQAHVWIENRSGNEAIPVVVQRSVDPLQVQVAGRPTVTIDPSTAVGTRAVRQQWEYRAITVSGGQDPVTAITRSGLESWEAVGFQSGGGGVVVLLKRPL